MKEKLCIQSKRVYIRGQFIAARILFGGERIEGVFSYDENDETVIDYGEKRILPGFIDIHTHGAYGFDADENNSFGLTRWADRLPEEGVTSFLPTLVTDQTNVLKKACENISDVMDTSYSGAEILGIHMEGPFLDRDFKGAHPEEDIVKPNIEQFFDFQKAARGRIKYLTVAPEHDENYRLIRFCTHAGVSVSLGHSGATYEQALLASANGAVCMTHVYNGMSAFKHRETGLAGAALRMGDMFGEIIADGHHVTPEALNIFYKCKGKYHAIMVTDSIGVKHCADKNGYYLGETPVEVKENGLAYIKGTDTIAGSTLSMNRGLRVLIEDAGVPVEDAINSCTINPATLLNIQDRKGQILAGTDADLTVIDDEYNVIDTYCRGIRYEKTT